MKEKWYSKMLNDWGTGRIVRTLLGAAIVVGGVLTGESLPVVLGVWLLLQGLLNMSCCCGGACGVTGGEKPLFQDQIKTYRPEKKD